MSTKVEVIDVGGPYIRCVSARCISGIECIGKKSGDTGVLYSFPSPCLITEETLVYYERRDKLEYELSDGFCITYKPIRALLPDKICRFFDKMMSGKPESKILLGPGGTGKSLTLEIIKRTAPFNIVEFEPESLLRKFVGESEAELYNILWECEESEPCLLLVDEADILIETRRGSMHEGTREVTQNLIRILLRRLQKWYNEKRLLGLVGASNLPASVIDKPMLRAGRLGEPIYFPIPDKKAIKKLAELFGKQLADEEIEKMVRYGLPHSNIVHYLTEGELQLWVPESFAGLEYSEPKTARKKIHLGEKSRVVIAEHWEVGLKLASIITGVEYGKPVLYLKDPHKILDLNYLGRSMKFPVAIPYTTLTLDADKIFYDYPHTVFFIGKRWDLPYVRLTTRDIVGYYGDQTILQVFCKKVSRVINVESKIPQCISGIEL